MSVSEEIPKIHIDDFKDNYRYLQIKAAELEKKFNFIKLADDGVIELYADNQMLQSLRLCEAKFTLEHLGLSLSGIPIRGRGLKPWPLVFGAWLHDCLQVFYEQLKLGKQIPILEWVEFGEKKWHEHGLEKYRDVEIRYQKIGGMPGGKALLAHYWAFFGEGAERFRVVATEVCFGRDREVPIVDNHRAYPYLPVRCYLTGRMDLITDDGSTISPTDHKSHSRFTGKEQGYFNPNDGPTGYIYSLRHIMNQLFPDLIKQGRLCDSIWINHISVEIAKERFKRSRIRKSESQLEEYRERMVASFTKLFELVFLERKPDWNTSVCNNIYFRPCEYKALHEQAPEDRVDLLRANYVDGEAWNPYRIEGIE